MIDIQGISPATQSSFPELPKQATSVPFSEKEWADFPSKLTQHFLISGMEEQIKLNTAQAKKDSERLRESE